MRAVLAGASLALAVACESSSPTKRSPPPADLANTAARVVSSASATPRPAATPRFVPAPRDLDAAAPFIQEQVERALGARERALVYVGAPWCEPCQRFHAAVLRGELDDVLAGIRLVEFDADRHDPALHRAGYAYEFIPVIALPAADGRSSGRLLSGSIKGPAAVEDDLAPRLRALLSGREVD